MAFEAQYSGPGKSGICVCGCPWDSHHLGVVGSKEYRDQTGEGYMPDECCRYGCNEVGGMKYVDGEWVEHCQQYEDRGI